jgi:hypothetical protein
MRTHSSHGVKHFALLSEIVRAFCHRARPRASSSRAQRRTCSARSRADLSTCDRTRTRHAIVRDDHCVLADGRYDAIVVDADARAGDGDDAAVALTLAITAGEHKGEVVELVARHFDPDDALTMIGLPCTLVVSDGLPRIEP